MRSVNVHCRPPTVVKTLIGIGAGLLFTTSAAARQSGAPDPPQVCVAVHVDPLIRSRESQTFDLEAANALNMRLGALLRRNGVSEFTNTRLAKVQTTAGLGAPNPACLDSRVTHVMLDYLPLVERGMFRSELRISQAGRTIFADATEIDVRELPAARTIDKVSFYIGEDMETQAERIFSIVDWE